MGNTITKQEFLQAVVNAVKMIYGIRAEVSVADIKLNNGNRSCIQVQCGQNTYANMYMDSYYQAFWNGDLSAVMGAAEAVIQAKEDGKAHEDVLDGMVQKLLDYEQAKDILMCRLVNTELNRDALNRMPNIPFHDLSITFCLMVDTAGNQSTGVNNGVLDYWGVSIDELYRDALANMQEKMPARIKNIFEAVTDTEDMAKELEKAAKDAGAQPLCILTNRIGIMGAAVILYPGVLESCAEKMGGDFYLFPNSIHEFLISPVAGMDISPDEMRRIIRHINQEELEPDDVLADHAYLYSAAEKKLVMV